MTYLYENDRRAHWMGELPSGWRATRLPMIINRKNTGVSIGKEYWNKGYNVLYTCSKKSYKSNFVGFPEQLKTTKNDLLFARMANPYVFLPPVGSIYTEVVYRILIKEGVSKEFIRYALISSSRFIVRHGVTMDSLNFQRWGQLVFPLPPRDIQEKIANYLPSRLEKIDQKIEAIDKGLGILPKIMSSMMSEIIWQSGCGNMIPMRAIVQDVRKKTTDMSNPVCLANFDRTTGKYIETNLTVEPITGIEFQSGDILFNRIGYKYAKSWVADKSGAMLGDVRVFRVNTQGVLPNYLRYVMLSPEYKNLVMATERGVTLRRSPSFAYQKFCVPIPSLERQQEIVDALDKEWEKVNKMTEVYKKLKPKFKQFRESLLYEAVTGKIPLEDMV